MSETDDEQHEGKTLGEAVGEHLAEVAIVGGLLLMLILSLTLSPDSRAIDPASGSWSHAQTYLLFLLTFVQILMLARLLSMGDGL